MSAATVTNRLDRLKTQIMARGGSFTEVIDPQALDIARFEAYRVERSRGQERAALLLEQVRRAIIEFPSHWTLAGEHLPKAGRGSTAPQGFYFAKSENDLPDDDRYSRADWEAMRDRDRPGRQAETTKIGEVSLDTTGGEGKWVMSDNCAFWAWGWIENHSVRNYAVVVEKGYGGLLTEIEAELADLAPEDPTTPERETLLLSLKTVCEAGILLGERYASAAEAAAESTDDSEDRARLKAMAEACRQVPARGARSFQEAVQALWLAHILTCGEDGINANSFGRIDQILYPTYRADKDAGRLTDEEATELMAEFACKLYLDYDVQTITLGGKKADGTDATNELSSIILEATRRVGFIRALNIRIHEQSPEAFLEQASDLILKGGGIPYIFNDDCYIDALHERGVSLEDARDYAVIGCVELTLPGKANPRAVSGWFNALKCLELAINGGVDPKTGDQIGPACKPLNELCSFDELMANYKATVEVLAKRMVYMCNRGELRQRELGPMPCWSLLTDDCLKEGRDITDGGARYNYHSICFMAAPNVADGLMAIKQRIFEEQSLDAGDLLTALRNDFQGAEPLRQQLLNGPQKYGNNEPVVDALAAEVCDHFIDLMDDMRSPCGGRYFVHLFSFRCNIEFGKMTGATPDGRHAGQSFAYSLSAHPGRDEDGLTAMLSSLAAIPHRKAAGGSAAIIDITPNLFDEDGGARRLAQLVRGAFKMGVGQLQFNVVSEEQMIKAKECPETHGNLQVRVAGYSQMFKLLTEDLQDHLISRTKHER